MNAVAGGKKMGEGSSFCLTKAKKTKKRGWRGKCDDGEDMYKRFSPSIGWVFERVIHQEEGECL